MLANRGGAWSDVRFYRGITGVLYGPVRGLNRGTTGVEQGSDGGRMGVGGGSASCECGHANRGGTGVGDHYKGRICSVFVRFFYSNRGGGLDIDLC